MNVIEYAEKRLSDPDNEDHDTRYWAAYLDGARAQLKECEREFEHENRSD